MSLGGNWTSLRISDVLANGVAFTVNHDILVNPYILIFLMFKGFPIYRRITNHV